MDLQRWGKLSCLQITEYNMYYILCKNEKYSNIELTFLLQLPTYTQTYHTDESSNSFRRIPIIIMRIGVYIMESVNGSHKSCPA